MTLDYRLEECVKLHEQTDNFTGLLKKFLRQLPESLIPKSSLMKLCQVIGKTLIVISIYGENNLNITLLFSQ
jgi:hypothetical protein